MPRRPAGGDLGQDEFAGRSAHDRRALPRQPGRRADRSGRPRHLLPAARRARACRRTSASRASSAASSSMAASSASAPAMPALARRPRFSSPRPTGCRAISTAASRPWCRSRTRPCISRCWTRSWSPTCKDEAQSWDLEPDGAITASHAGDADAFSAHTYLHDQPEPVGPRQRAEASQAGAARPTRCSMT